jgi:RHS repeat-associated protein
LTNGGPLPCRRDAVIQRTAAKEFGQVFVYDELDRVKQRPFPDGETFNYTYDGLRLTSISADPANPAFKGKVLKSADYDALGRMKTIAIGETTGGATLATNTYTYDATHARLTRVQGAVPSSTPLDLNVVFDGLGRLTSQTGTLGAEAVSRSYTYDGLSRLKTAVGPWEKATGAPGAVTFTYSYDALGNLRGQASTRSPANLADTRTWSYAHTTKPHFLSSFAQANQPTETLAATAGGEVATISRPSLPTETLVWNALGKLRAHKSSTYSYDAFGELVQTVTGPSGSPSSIVSVGDDFEYDVTALRSNKYFSIQGVRIASLATSYTAPTASVPPALRIVVRFAEPLAAPAAVALLALGLLSLASLTLRRRTPVWLSLPGVGVLSFTLVALPYTAHAATLTSGPGAYGRHGEPILAYLVDHLGTIRGAVNQAGVVVETRDYAPFGESIAHTGTFAVQHRFTGQPQDDQAGGLYNYGARFYNAKWGRFISPDERVQGFDSQGLNPFTYVLNRPTSLLDRDGRQAVSPEFSTGVPAHGPGTSADDPEVQERRELEAELKAEQSGLARAQKEAERLYEAAGAALGTAVTSQGPERTGAGAAGGVLLGLAKWQEWRASRHQAEIESIEAALRPRRPTVASPKPTEAPKPARPKGELSLDVDPNSDWGFEPDPESDATPKMDGPPSFFVPFQSAFGPVL